MTEAGEAMYTNTTSGWRSFKEQSNGNRWLCSAYAPGWSPLSSPSARLPILRPETSSTK
jgi:hypothetical protein